MQEIRFRFLCGLIIWRNCMRALFIGNSHTYMNDMPYLFQEIYHDSFHEEEDKNIVIEGHNVYNVDTNIKDYIESEEKQKID